MIEERGNDAQDTIDKLVADNARLTQELNAAHDLLSDPAKMLTLSGVIEGEAKLKAERDQWKTHYETLRGLAVRVADSCPGTVGFEPALRKLRKAVAEDEPATVAEPVETDKDRFLRTLRFVVHHAEIVNGGSGDALLSRQALLGELPYIKGILTNWDAAPEGTPAVERELVRCLHTARFHLERIDETATKTEALAERHLFDSLPRAKEIISALEAAPWAPKKP